jgi:hypothetical protein
MISDFLHTSPSTYLLTYHINLCPNSGDPRGYFPHSSGLIDGAGQAARTLATLLSTQRVPVEKRSPPSATLSSLLQQQVAAASSLATCPNPESKHGGRRVSTRAGLPMFKPGKLVNEGMFSSSNGGYQHGIGRLASIDRMYSNKSLHLELNSNALEGWQAVRSTNGGAPRRRPPGVCARAPRIGDRWSGLHPAQQCSPCDGTVPHSFQLE